MKPVRQVTCSCPMSRAGMIEHSIRICAVVRERRAVLKLFASPGGVVCVFNTRRRRIRTAKRRAGKQAAA